MKKTFLLACVILVIAGTINAQKYYARLGVGVGFGLAFYGTSTDRTINGNTSDVSEMKSGSLGTGLNINLGAGYMFSKYIVDNTEHLTTFRPFWLTTLYYYLSIK